MQNTASTACLIVIGNEILSGRTQDKNVAWLAKALNEKGIPLKEVRVVADEEDAIVAAVNACRKQYAYVFTTGGIGPTHDDITSASVAKAFDVPFERHPQAEKILRDFYKEKINATRLKMAEMPRGAELIPNPVSIAPGFRLDNVYVMAGVPSIMQAMYAAIHSGLKEGKKTLSKPVSAYVREGDIGEELSAIAKRHPVVDIGSYPFARNTRLGVTLIARSTDSAALDKAHEALTALLEKHAPAVYQEDLATVAVSSDKEWGAAVSAASPGGGSSA